MKTLIICYGNDLIGNDGFGKVVHDALGESVDKLFTRQLLPELLEQVKNYERLIFVDAAEGVLDTCFYEVFASNDNIADFHFLSVGGFLSLLSGLYDKKPKAYMCCAFFDSFEYEAYDVKFNQKISEALELITSHLENSVKP